jgi:hypothetical protein
MSGIDSSVFIKFSGVGCCAFRGCRVGDVLVRLRGRGSSEIARGSLKDDVFKIVEITCQFHPN